MVLLHQQPHKTLKGHKLLIIVKYPGIGPILDSIRARFPDLAVVHIDREWWDPGSSDTVSDDEWKDVTVLLTGSAVPRPGLVPELKLVQLASAGSNDVLDRPLFTETDVTLCTANGVHG